VIEIDIFYFNEFYCVRNLAVYLFSRLVFVVIEIDIFAFAEFYCVRNLAVYSFSGLVFC